MAPSTPATESAPGLERGLSVWGTISLSVSDITPMSSLLVIAPVVLSVSGTGSVWAYLAGCFIAISVALCMGELGSMYPVAGGLYSIVTRVLGRPVGFIALVGYLAQGVFLPASIALGVGTYLHALVPAVPVNLSSAVAMALVTVLAMLRIQANAVLVAVFLGIEVAVIALLTLVGLTNWNQPASILSHPVVLDHGHLAPVAGTAIIAALATSLFSVNGYDSAINFSEETRGSARHVGQAVVIAALTGIVLEVAPFVAGLFGAPDLHAFLSSPTPLTDLVRTRWGGVAADLITIGALVAILNAVIAITLQFARIVWASARDEVWPPAVNGFLGRIHGRFRSPWAATLVIGVISTVLTYQASLVSAVTATALLIIVMYALVAIAALVSRLRDRGLTRPSRMPLWPLPPVIALVGVVLALTQQTLHDLTLVAGLFVAAAIYYAVYVRTRTGIRRRAADVTATALELKGE
jgi:amino acid transporter